MSTRDVESLILRAAIGGTMIAHGIRHGRTLEGTGRWFGSIGFRQPELQAAASAAVTNGFFITKEGYEYVLNLSAASVALAAIGPGRFSVDRALGLDKRLTPLQGAAIAAGVGLAAAAAQLAVFWRRPAPQPADDKPAESADG